jgi:hypothetical protein
VKVAEVTITKQETEDDEWGMLMLWEI